MTLTEDEERLVRLYRQGPPQFQVNLVVLIEQAISMHNEAQVDEPPPPSESFGASENRFAAEEAREKLTKLAEELVDWLYDQNVSAREAIAVMGIAMPAIISTLETPQKELREVYGIMSRTLHGKGFDV